MAEADVRLTAVTTDGAKLGEIIPANCMKKQDGKNALPGKWQILNGPTMTLTVSGKNVNSEESPFGGQPLMAEIDESEDMLGLHVTMGGFPLKAWMKKEGASTTLLFSNGGKWTKL